MRRRLLVALGVAAAAMLVAAPALAVNQYVTIKHVQYIPKTITIRQFDTIFWTHADSGLQHSVTAAPGQSDEFDSSPKCPPTCLVQRDTYTHTFKRAGTFTYYCRVHCPNNSCDANGMRGTVVVRATTTAAPAPAPPTATPGRASSSVSVTTPVPTLTPPPTPTVAPTEVPTPSPIASAVAAPLPARKSSRGLALGLGIGAVALAALGGGLLFVRLRRSA